MVHFKRVEETDPAIECLRAWVDRHAPSSVTLWLDRPVSNSGRLAARLRQRMEEVSIPWTIALVDSPDHVLREGTAVVGSADSAVIDGSTRWINIAHHIVAELELPRAPIDFRAPR